jgi:hypothetical protein
MGETMTPYVQQQSTSLAWIHESSGDRLRTSSSDALVVEFNVS